MTRMLTCSVRGEKKKKEKTSHHFEVSVLSRLAVEMAGFNRFGSSGLGSLYAGINSLQQSSGINRRDDRFDNRRNSRESGFDRRGDRVDFGRRDPSPRRRRYSPDPPYSGIRGSRQDDRGGLGSYSMDDLGRDSFNRNRGQSTSDRDHIRDGHNMRPPNRGDGILGAKPGDMPRDLTPNGSSGYTSQLAQQQQQLMAMVQTQSLLAAIQAQASAAAKRGGSGMHPPSLMQGMRMHDNRGGRMGDRQNRKRRMSPLRGQRNANQSNYRQRRSQQNRQQGNRSNNQQRKDSDKDRNKTSESSRKSEDKEPVEEPYLEETLDDEVENDEEEETKQEKGTSDETKEASEKTEPSTEKATKSEEQKSASKSEDQEFKSEFNLAGQNVNNLVKSLYDNSRGKYVCKVCKIMCTKETCFKQHLYGKRHVKTWLESRGQSFEAEMFKRASEEAAKSLAAKEQAKASKEKAEQDRQQKTEQAPDEKQEAKDKEESVKTKEEPTATGSSEEETTVKEEPVEVKNEKSPPPEPKKVPVKEEKMPVKVNEKVPIKEEKFEAVYSCDTRKVAIKEGEVITISSITEARVRLVGFDKGLNTQGCEFVKAVSGFNCRLCKTFILNGSDVMKHVQGKKHQAKYKGYLASTPFHAPFALEQISYDCEKVAARTWLQHQSRCSKAHQSSRKHHSCGKRYVSEHPKYESNQVVRNKELSEMLSEREGEELLLYEVTETEEPKRPYRYSSLDTMDVQVTKYVVAEDEPDDTMEDDQDESHSDLLKEDMDESASNEKKDDIEDDSHDVNGEDKDLESTEMENDVMLTPGDLDEKYDPDLGTDISEPTTEENTEEVTEAKDDPNTSIDSLTESQEEEDEPVEKKVKLATPTGRRGRRAARGGAQARGRGRGRGGKRATRQNVNTTPKQETPTADQNNDDENFMDGFEVIDEVVDDE